MLEDYGNIYQTHPLLINVLHLKSFKVIWTSRLAKDFPNNWCSREQYKVDGDVIRRVSLTGHHSILSLLLCVISMTVRTGLTIVLQFTFQLTANEVSQYVGLYGLVWVWFGLVMLVLIAPGPLPMIRDSPQLHNQCT